MSAPEPLPPPLHRQALLARGITDDEIRTARRQGVWQQLHRGVYVASDSFSAVKTEQRHRITAIAVAQRSPHLVLSHTSAAILHGLPLWGRSLDDVHLTRSSRSGGRTTPGRVVHSGILAPQEITTIDGVAVTAIGRTLIDLGTRSSFETTVIAADHALRRMSSPAQLAGELAGLRHRRGAGAARRALMFADGQSESAGESRTRMVIDRFGLPHPVLQVRIYTPGGILLGRCDLGYPEQGVLIEFDGKVKYLKPFRVGERPEEVVAREKRREDNIRAMGYLVIRFVWSDLQDPAAIAARINGSLEHGRRIVAAGGINGRWEADPARQVPHSRQRPEAL